MLLVSGKFLDIHQTDRIKVVLGVRRFNDRGTEQEAVWDL